MAGGTGGLTPATALAQARPAGVGRRAGVPAEPGHAPYGGALRARSPHSGDDGGAGTSHVPRAERCEALPNGCTAVTRMAHPHISLISYLR